MTGPAAIPTGLYRIIARHASVRPCSLFLAKCYVARLRAELYRPPLFGSERCSTLFAPVVGARDAKSLGRRGMKWLRALNAVPNQLAIREIRPKLWPAPVLAVGKRMAWTAQRFKIGEVIRFHIGSEQPKCRFVVDRQTFGSTATDASIAVSRSRRFALRWPVWASVAATSAAPERILLAGKLSFSCAHNKG